MAEMAPGSVFAGHRIESVAGRGGMGVVYRATQLALDRTVALKVIAPGLMDDDGMRKRFVRESKVAASIDHPNVIPIYYAGEEDGVAYIAMRYVSGDDLRSLVRREGRLEPRRAARLAGQIGAALDAAHAAGLVHRDVKPANVLLGPDDHVYLTDFGLTKHALSIGGATKPGHWVGTLDYVAPEQIRGERVDARADVYALGCLLYYMLTGEVTFPREGDEGKLWAHLSEDPPKPSERRPGLPAELDDVVTRALAKKPDDRFPSAGDLGRAAEAAVAGERPQQSERLVAVGAAAPIEAPTVTGGRLAPTQVVPRSEDETRVQSDPRGRRRRAAAGAVVLGALAAGVAAGALWLGASGDDPGTGSRATATPTATATAPPATPQGEVAARVPTGPRPNAIGLAGNTVLVGAFSSQRMTRIDARTGKRAGRGPEVGIGVSDAAGSRNAIWVTVSRQRKLLRFDPRTGRRVAAIDLPAEPNSVAVGPGAVWVGLITPTRGGDDMLLRLDPATGRIVKSSPIRLGIQRLAATRSAVWVANRKEPSLSRFDVRTGRVTSEIRIGTSRPSNIAYGAGSVWIASPRDNTVARVDPRDGNVIQIGVGGRPEGIAVRGDQVWVANYTDHTLTRIDPRTSRRVGEPVDVPLNPYAMAIGEDSVWVTSVGENRAVRVRFRDPGE